MTPLQRFDEHIFHWRDELSQVKKDSIKSFLQAELERCVPDAIPDVYDDSLTNKKPNDWNACRAEMLKRINT